MIFIKLILKNDAIVYSQNSNYIKSCLLTRKIKFTFINGCIITENAIMNCVTLEKKGIECIKIKRKYLGKWQLI